MNEAVMGKPVLVIRLTQDIIDANPALQADEEGPGYQAGQRLLIWDNGTWGVDNA